MQIDAVRNLKIKSFTAGRAFINLEHQSSFQELITLIEEQNLSVAKNGTYWEIKERR
jgi:hypothetical protein